MIISGFPGVGKSYYCKNIEYAEGACCDSDSSKFDKSEFPGNYIKHIKKQITVYNTVLVSTHLEVRKAMVDEGLRFVLVYPDRSLKEEYLERYRKRGSPQVFLDLLDKNWDVWLDTIHDQPRGNYEPYMLRSGEYLSDLVRALFTLEQEGWNDYVCGNLPMEPEKGRCKDCAFFRKALTGETSFCNRKGNRGVPMEPEDGCDKFEEKEK